MTLGIIGAGKLGITLAQLAVKAGYEVVISGSGDARKIRLIVETLAAGATPATNKEVTAQAEVIILALPLSRFRKLDSGEFTGKLLIDAMNYWWEVDGPRTSILPDTQSTSEAVQEYFSGAQVVKAFSHVGYHELHDGARPRGSDGRKAIALVTDSDQGARATSRIIDALGFDPVFIGSLENGRKLEPGTPAFGASLSAGQLRRVVE